MLLHLLLCSRDLVMYTTYDRKKYCDCCYRPICCACVCFYFIYFVTAFIL